MACPLKEADIFGLSSQWSGHRRRSVLDRALLSQALRSSRLPGAQAWCIRAGYGRMAEADVAS
jgi:hypothetical protein